MRDKQTVKIELLSKWKLEAEFRNKLIYDSVQQMSNGIDKQIFG